MNNRIEMLPRIENRIRRLCPEARIVIAHGQLPAEEMAEIANSIAQAIDPV